MEDIKERIVELEKQMSVTDFWTDKIKAQQIIKELSELKDKLAGAGKYDKGNAVITILAGAGGDDAEDFARMLYDMYIAYIDKRGWNSYLLHKNENDHGGYRNITFDVQGKNAYGTLKNESGVHRLVRISPFSSKKLRHTSFALVEVVPKFKKGEEFELSQDELKIEFSRASGPGGQNVNKRETAVRVVHIPTGLAVHVDSERSQAQNKEQALALLKAKLFKLREDERKEKEGEMYISKTTDIQWGNQIRSYVLHPYKMVKDHRTDIEVRGVEDVLEKGELDEFIEAERNL
jgi:peptide chain release factor 2